jgi:hypothetical protein
LVLGTICIVVPCVFTASYPCHACSINLLHYSLLLSRFSCSVENDIWNLMSVCPCIVDDMKRVKPTRCYTMVYWTLWFAQHVSGIIMHIIRSLRLYRWPQLVAPHLGYGRLLVWSMACNIPLLGRLNLQPCTRPATCHNQGEVTHAGAVCIMASSWWWA